MLTKSDTTEEEGMAETSPFPGTELLWVTAVPPPCTPPVLAASTNSAVRSVCKELLPRDAVPKLGSGSYLESLYLFPTRKWSHIGKPHIQLTHIQSNQKKHICGKAQIIQI